MDIQEIKQRVLAATQAMVRRGAPNSYDDMGYNKISYGAVGTILGKPYKSMKDYERLIHHLIRHKGQVATFEDIDYLKEAQAFILEFPVDILFSPEREEITVMVPYSDDYIKSLRKVPGMTYRASANHYPVYSAIELAREMNKHWPVFGKRLGMVLKEHGWDTKRIKEEYPEELKAAKEKVKAYDRPIVIDGEVQTNVTVSWRSDLEMILVHCADYDANMVAAVKALKHDGRRWVNADKSWHVIPSFYELLKDNLQKGGVEYTDNAKFAITSGGYKQATKTDYAKSVASVDTSEALELIMRDYSVLQGRTQYQHQLEGEAFMLAAGNCINADLMGLGKSLQTIVATHIQRQRNDMCPVLIIVPASLKTNWVRELYQWLGSDAGIVQVVSNQQSRSYMYDKSSRSKFMQLKIKASNAAHFGLSHKGIKETTAADYVIINYDLLEKLRQDIIDWRKRTGAKIVVADEAHYMKNFDAKRTKAILGYSGFEKITEAEKLKMTEAEKAKKNKRIKVEGIVEGFEIRYALTGTPITGKNLDMLPLAKFIKHPLADNVKGFKERYCAPDSNRFGVTYNGATNSEELYAEMSTNMIQRRTKDVMSSMPDKSRQFKYVDIDQEEYWRQWDEYVSTYYERTGKEFNEAAAQLTELNVLRNVASALKIPQVLEFANELLEEDKERKVIIFTGYTATAKAIMEEFADVGVVRITGGMNDKQRDDAIQAFQNNKNVRVIVCNYKAAAVGVTLTAADSVIMADLMWLPSDHFQAEDRAWRIGQEKNVIVYYLIASQTHEESVKRIVDEKAKIIDLMEEKNFEVASNWAETFEAFMADLKSLRAG